MLTDSHTHLYLDNFNNDLDVVIKNALHNKVNRFLLPNIDNETLPQLLNVYQKYQNIVFPMIGLHPCSVNQDYVLNLQRLKNQFHKAPFIAIGEIGMDLHWEKKFAQEQKKAFSIQLNWAKEYNLPIVIHNRNAFKEICSILELHKGKLRGVFHCFSGSYMEAKKIIDLGFYIGIGGIITFKNSNLQEVIKKIGLKNIILETDAPYLAPHPMRGKRNEPKFLKITAEKVSESTGIKMQKISEITNQNIDNIFFKKK